MYNFEFNFGTDRLTGPASVTLAGKHFRNVTETRKCPNFVLFHHEDSRKLYKAVENISNIDLRYDRSCTDRRRLDTKKTRILAYTRD